MHLADAVGILGFAFIDPYVEMIDDEVLARLVVQRSGARFFAFARQLQESRQSIALVIRTIEDSF